MLQALGDTVFGESAKVSGRHFATRLGHVGRTNPAGMGGHLPSTPLL